MRSAALEGKGVNEQVQLEADRRTVADHNQVASQPRQPRRDILWSSVHLLQRGSRRTECHCHCVGQRRTGRFFRLHRGAEYVIKEIWPHGRLRQIKMRIQFSRPPKRNNRKAVTVREPWKPNPGFPLFPPPLEMLSVISHIPTTSATDPYI